MENIHFSLFDQDNTSEKDSKGETGNGDDTSIEEVLPLNIKWYTQVSLFIDNFYKVHQRLCRWSGFVVSIDEIMKKFKGILKQNLEKEKSL